MFKTFIFLCGLLLSIIGIIFIITYLNFLEIGLTGNEYFALINSRIECWFFVLGMFLMFTCVLT